MAAAFAIIRAVRVLLGATLLIAIALVAVGAAPTLLGYESFTVYSGSMEPALRVGALAVVKPVPMSSLVAGDVITFRKATQLDVVITHRLIAIDRTEDGRTLFRTKGDANDSEDVVPVDLTALLGKVVYSVPYGGYVVDLARRPQGRTLLIGLPLLAFALDAAWSAVGRGGKRGAAGATPAAASHAVAPPAAVDQPVPAPVVAALAEVTAAAATGSTGVSDVNEALWDRLLASGEQSLEIGNLRGAQTAAEAVLSLDPRNERAWLLKARTLVQPDERIALLRSALLVNPHARGVAAELERYGQALSSGSPDPGSPARPGPA